MGPAKPVRATGPALNTSPPPIEVQYGLEANDVEFAILLAVTNPARPPALAPGTTIDAAALNRILAGSTPAESEGYPWSLVERKPGMIFAAYHRDRVEMRVAIRFDDQLVLLRILESRNLGQAGDYIDADAFVRLQDLDRRIRERLVAVAQRNWYHQPVAASP